MLACSVDVCDYQWNGILYAIFKLLSYWMSYCILYSIWCHIWYCIKLNCLQVQPITQAQARLAGATAIPCSICIVAQRVSNCRHRSIETSRGTIRWALIVNTVASSALQDGLYCIVTVMQPFPQCWHMKLRPGLTAAVRVRPGRVSLTLRQLVHWQSGSAGSMSNVNYVISALTVWVSQTTLSEWLLVGQVIATGVYPAGARLLVLWIWNMTAPTLGPSTCTLVRLQSFAHETEKATQWFDANALNIKPFVRPGSWI